MTDIMISHDFFYIYNIFFLFHIFPHFHSKLFQHFFAETEIQEAKYYLYQQYIKYICFTTVAS